MKNLFKLNLNQLKFKRSFKSINENIFKQFCKKNLPLSVFRNNDEEAKELNDIVLDEEEIIESDVKKSKKYFEKMYKKYPEINEDFYDPVNDKIVNIIPTIKPQIRKFDHHQEPQVRTVRVPDSEDTVNSRFKKKPNMSSKFNLNPDYIDDYFVVGAEIFRNYFKDQAEQNKPFDPYSKDFTNDLLSNMEIQEFRNSEEKYGPVKKDYFFYEFKDNSENAKHLEKYKEFYGSQVYVDRVNDERFRPMFVPSYREKREFLSPLVALNREFKEKSREIHNIKMLEKLSLVSTIFKQTYDVYNPEIDSIIDEFKKIKIESKENFKYPDLIEFAFSNVVINRCIEEGKFDDVAKYFSAENSIKINLLCGKLFNEVEKLDIHLIGDLVLKLCFELNLNIKPIWTKIEERVLNNIQHLTLEDICRITYAANFSSPKYTTPNFRRQLRTEVMKGYKTATPIQIVNILVGFKLSKDVNLYTTLLLHIKENLNNWLENYAKDTNRQHKKSTQDLKFPENFITAVSYAVAFGKPRFRAKDAIDGLQDTQEIMQDLIDSIINFLPQMSLKQILACLHAVALTEIHDGPDLIMLKTERIILNNLEKNINFLNHRDLGELIGLMNQLKRGKSCGSEDFVLKMLKLAISMDLNKFSSDEFCEIVYLSSSRRLEYDNNGVLDEYKKNIIDPIIQKINNSLNERAEKLNSYKQLSLVFYHLMFTKCEDTKLIDKLLKACDSVEGKLSISYYNAFRYFDYYLRNWGALPKTYNYENLFHFRDRFFYAEHLTNVAKQEGHFNLELRNSTILYTLKERLRYLVICAVPYENLFLIPFILENRKIAVMINYEKDYIYNTKKLHPKILLNHEFLKTRKHWETICMTWDQYIKLGNVIEREKKIHDMIEDLTEKQVKKGIYVRNQKVL